ncbi:MAG TPA: FKBP-type peptidyl-prolyl cis-trans isomerase [Bacteroidia bacterium]|jgi:peptidylprolyl isomerase|nr:FKBP-type peptidyl-prolyl cis-trans isomerase [Bacteroidia bacterium]
MKRTLLFPLLAATLVIFSFTAPLVMHKPCKPKAVKKPKTITTASGLQFKLTTTGCGAQAQSGDKVKVHYTGKLTNDTVFDSSVKRGEPIEFKLGVHQVIKGWDEGIALMHIGDKATFTIPPDLGYGPQAVGKIPANSTLVFDVELIDIKPGVHVWDAKGKDTVTTASGLKVVYMSDTKLPEFSRSNTAAQAAAGNKVKVHYSGFLLDGSCFDSSVERGQPFEFTLGQGMVIKGWDEGIALLHKGEKAKLIIPYGLAYGEHGHPPVIPAKATLVFDVELVDFTK